MKTPEEESTSSKFIGWALIGIVVTLILAVVYKLLS